MILSVTIINPRKRWFAPAELRITQITGMNPIRSTELIKINGWAPRIR